MGPHERLLGEFSGGVRVAGPGETERDQLGVFVQEELLECHHLRVAGRHGHMMYTSAGLDRLSDRLEPAVRSVFGPSATPDATP